MKENLLLIGGPMDGGMMVGESAQTVITVQGPRTAGIMDFNQSAKDLPILTANYRRVEICFNKRDDANEYVAFRVHEDMTDSVALQRLIMCYNP